METRLLEYFIAVAEEANFTRAAERLYVVQSTVSAGIRTLETELGATLLDRSGRRATLTAAGEALLAPARAVIDGVHSVHNAVTGRVQGRLRVGTFANIPSVALPRLFAEFRARHPLVQLQLASSPSGSRGLVEDLHRGRVDLAFMGLPASELPDLETQELTRSPFIALVPAVSPLAEREEIGLAELMGEPFVDSPAGFGQRVIMERHLVREGLQRTVATEVPAVGDIPSFVAAGFGVALLPRSLVWPSPDVVVVPLAERIDWPFGIATRPHPGPAATALRDLIVERLSAPD